MNMLAWYLVQGSVVPCHTQWDFHLAHCIWYEDAKQLYLYDSEAYPIQFALIMTAFCWEVQHWQHLRRGGSFLVKDHSLQQTHSEAVEYTISLFSPWILLPYWPVTIPDYITSFSWTWIADSRSCRCFWSLWASNAMPPDTNKLQELICAIASTGVM